MHRVDVMGHHPDREAALLAEPRQEIEDGALRVGIDPGGGLVEEQQIGLGRNRARQQHALALASRQLGEAFGGELAGAAGGQGLPGSGPLPRAGETPEGEVPPGALERHLEGGERIEGVQRFALGNVPDAQAGPAPHATRKGRQEAQQPAQQGRLAAPVGAEQHHELLRPDREGRPAHHRPAVVAEVGSLQRDQRGVAAQLGLPCTAATSAFRLLSIEATYPSPSLRPPASEEIVTTRAPVRSAIVWARGIS